MVCFLRNRDLYEKGTEKSCISVPLNFNLVENEQLPKNESGSCSKFISGKNIAKPSSAGRDECFARNGDEVHSQKLYTFSIRVKRTVSSLLHFSEKNAKKITIFEKELEKPGRKV